MTSAETRAWREHMRRARRARLLVTAKIAAIILASGGICAAVVLTLGSCSG